MNEENARLATFTNWPLSAPIRPGTLARLGFYYTGQGDTVTCYMCSMALGTWEHGDNPLEKHRRQNPNCPTLSDRDNLSAVNLFALPHHSRLEIDGIQSLTPLIPIVNRCNPDEQSREFLKLSSFRMRTFHDWDYGHIVSAERLAEAGFFYTGRSDRVRCAFCGKDIHDWALGDIPTEEHARLVPECQFVRYGFCRLTSVSRPPTEEASEQANREIETSRRLKELTDENKQLREERLCSVCFGREKDQVLQPCGHLVCSYCLCHLCKRWCPMCREHFTADQTYPVILPSVDLIRR